MFDVGQDPAAGLFIVMEFLEGEDLAACLTREKKTHLERVYRNFALSGRALGKAHKVGVIHRDLKPANILVLDRKEQHVYIKILDLGISKFLQDEIAAKIEEEDNI
ncbi:protein kinase domain-containing protein [Pajaroellobacter abortibovis]|uniref:Protein kinase domain-containing protein n=1 Tax=Pajaroellobacter abortibovis TaxID=1882918 RepID=A0A1L6MV37_9BACT|nr:protein kinase [Pajaroellobacter abortibovis]APR99315.1 hypothetical protein BCY86_00460 [Pajaroellobacter abortibovis]